VAGRGLEGVGTQSERAAHEVSGQFGPPDASPMITDYFTSIGSDRLLPQRYIGPHWHRFNALSLIPAWRNSRSVRLVWLTRAWAFLLW